MSEDKTPPVPARWKLFSVWKRAIMRIRVKKCSKTLNSNLLTLDDGLRGPLMRIRSRCVDASTWNILEIPLRQTHTLAQFEQMQEEKIAQILQQLKDVWEEIRRELVESCQVSLRLFLEANGFSTEDAKAGAEGTVDASAADGTIVVREEQVKQVSYTERATTRTQCRKLSKFIRTAQFLLNTGRGGGGFYGIGGGGLHPLGVERKGRRWGRRMFFENHQIRRRIKTYPQFANFMANSGGWVSGIVREI